MHTYRVTGTIQYRVHSRWSEITITEEVRAWNAGEAKRAVLERHEGIAQETDPHALVRWHTPERVGTQRVTTLDWQA